MTFKPDFEVVAREMAAVRGEQSTEIAAMGFDGTRLLVQFHRLSGIYAAPATRVQYERLRDAESLSAAYCPMVAEILPGDPRHFGEYHRLSLTATRPKRK